MPYYGVKDAFSIILVLFIFFVFVVWCPDKLGHSDNFILANSLVTPAHIVPEWYFLRAPLCLFFVCWFNRSACPSVMDINPLSLPDGETLRGPKHAKKGEHSIYWYVEALRGKITMYYWNISEEMYRLLYSYAVYINLIVNTGRILTMPNKLTQPQQVEMMKY